MVEDLIKHLHEQSQGRVKWFAMNKDESAYFIDFHTTWEAGEWMERQKKHSADWLEREGVHMVEKRIFTELEELAKQAADALEQKAAVESERDALLAAAGKEAVAVASDAWCDKHEAQWGTPAYWQQKLGADNPPVAWKIDCPDEPELGHWFDEEPDPSARSIPLYASPAIEASAPAGLTEREQFIWNLGYSSLEKGDGRDALEGVAQYFEDSGDPEGAAMIRRYAALSQKAGEQQ
jgi:hypothetical protein